MTTNKPQIKIVNVETGEEVVRDATADEIKQMQANTNAALAQKAEVEAKEIAKAALLSKLGITAEEAALLF